MLYYPLSVLVVLALTEKRFHSNTVKMNLAAATDVDEVPSLPMLTEQSDVEGIPQISLGGEAYKFTDLGPIIINTDGTTRRIANWDTLTKHEQENTWRLIQARNKKRIANLKKNADNEANTAASVTEEVKAAETSRDL